jgi:hypothetical protein
MSPLPPSASMACNGTALLFNKYFDVPFKPEHTFAFVKSLKNEENNKQYDGAKKRGRRID